MDLLNVGASTRMVNHILTFRYICSPLSLDIEIIVQTHVTETTQLGNLFTEDSRGESAKT